MCQTHWLYNSNTVVLCRLCPQKSINLHKLILNADRPQTQRLADCCAAAVLSTEPLMKPSLLQICDRKLQ